MSATYTDPAVCPECGRRVATLIPRGGDGTGSVYRRHLHHRGGAVMCAGGRLLVRPDAAREAADTRHGRE